MAGHRSARGRRHARDPLAVPPPRGPRPDPPYGALTRTVTPPSRPTAGRHRRPPPVHLTRRGRAVIGVVIAASVG
ncbi:MAG: hypothetical protein ACRDTP_09290, partial [Mycobacteriales bacterium]